MDDAQLDAAIAKMLAEGMSEEDIAFGLEQGLFVDEAPAAPAKSLAGFGSNIVSDAKGLVSGAGSALNPMNWPGMIAGVGRDKAAFDAKVNATDFQHPTKGNATLGSELGRLGDAVYEKPVTSALTALPLAKPAMVGVRGATGAAANTLGKAVNVSDNLLTAGAKKYAKSPTLQSAAGAGIGLYNYGLPGAAMGAILGPSQGSLISKLGRFLGGDKSPVDNTGGRLGGKAAPAAAPLEAELQKALSTPEVASTAPGAQLQPPTRMQNNPAQTPTSASGMRQLREETAARNEVQGTPSIPPVQQRYSGWAIEDYLPKGDVVQKAGTPGVVAAPKPKPAPKPAPKPEARVEAPAEAPKPKPTPAVSVKPAPKVTPESLQEQAKLATTPEAKAGFTKAAEALGPPPPGAQWQRSVGEMTDSPDIRPYQLNDSPVGRTRMASTDSVATAAEFEALKQRMRLPSKKGYSKGLLQEILDVIDRNQGKVK